MVEYRQTRKGRSSKKQEYEYMWTWSTGSFYRRPKNNDEWKSFELMTGADVLKLSPNIVRKAFENPRKWVKE